MKFKRVYHPWDKWEEISHNMWGEADKSIMPEVISFTADHALYGKYMMQIVEQWPISCENALTDYRLNRKAWVGHAACALAHRWPQHIVREAWGKLTDEQRILANKEASRAIQHWEYNYAESKGLHQNMGGSLL